MKLLCYVCLLSAWLAAESLLAQTMVTEMSFRTPAENGSGETVAMDVFPEVAQGTIVLKGDGTQRTEIVTNATGIGRVWVEKLRSGYLNVDYFANTGSRNQVGVTTTDRFWCYTGGSSASGNLPITMYMVMQPNGRWHEGNGRRTLWGTGHAGDGYVRLWYQDKEFRFAFGQKISGVTSICEVKLTQEWHPECWYFVAVSWAKDTTPVLYVREMTAAGENSPAPVMGILTEGANYQAVPPPGRYRHPTNTPLGIGCYYYNPGSGEGTIDGLDGKVNWLRIDSGFSDVEQIESVFCSLVAPDEATVILLQ